MAKIVLAKHAGFCFGVKRAVDCALDLLDDNKVVYTYGDIIHNKDVVDMIKGKGGVVLESIEDKENIDLLIRSHGVGESIYKDCIEKNINLIDMTCPFVSRVHKIVQKSTVPVIIVGEEKHPEIIGVKGWTKTECKVVKSIEQAQELPDYKEAIVVVQTTFDMNKFEDIIKIVEPKVKQLTVYNTICSSTVERQKEALEMSKTSDVMIVIGGKHSSNTKKLYEICKNNCENTHFIENQDEITLEILKTSGIIGVIAGASTPVWIIREVLTTMSQMVNSLYEDEQSCECSQPSEGEKNNATNNLGIVKDEVDQFVGDSDVAFADMVEDSLRTIKVKDIVCGTVVQVNKNTIFVNIGYKSDGVIHKNEYTNDDSVVLDEAVKLGDTIEAQVLKLNDGEGNVLLSVKRIANRKMWTDLEERFQDKDVVYTVVCKEVVNGGLVALLDDKIRVFIPASLVDVRYIKDLTQFVDQTMDIKITEFDRTKRKIVGSRKAILAEKLAKEKEELWSKFEAKNTIEGTVKRITDFGAFVDIGGVDGLLHVADIAWYRIGSPNEVLNVNDKIEVLILSVNKEKERISLGLKQLQPKPWETAGEKYSEGQVINGKVVRVLDFGAFVELEPGVDGLIHISQIALKHVESVESELKVGDEVECKIISVDAGNKKISLSVKELLKERMPKKEYKPVNNEEDTYIPEITESSVSLSEFLPEGFLDEF